MKTSIMLLSMIVLSCTTSSCLFDLVPEDECPVEGTWCEDSVEYSCIVECNDFWGCVHRLEFSGCSTGKCVDGRCEYDLVDDLDDEPDEPYDGPECNKEASSECVGNEVYECWDQELVPSINCEALGMNHCVDVSLKFTDIPYATCAFSNSPCEPEGSTKCVAYDDTTEGFVTCSFGYWTRIELCEQGCELDGETAACIE